MRSNRGRKNGLRFVPVGLRFAAERFPFEVSTFDERTTKDGMKRRRKCVRAEIIAVSNDVWLLVCLRLWPWELVWLSRVSRQLRRLCGPGGRAWLSKPVEIRTMRLEPMLPYRWRERSDFFAWSNAMLCFDEARKIARSDSPDSNNSERLPFRTIDRGTLQGHGLRSRTARRDDLLLLHTRLMHAAWMRDFVTGLCQMPGHVHYPGADHCRFCSKELSRTCSWRGWSGMHMTRCRIPLDYVYSFATAGEKYTMGNRFVVRFPVGPTDPTHIANTLRDALEWHSEPRPPYRSPKLDFWKYQIRQGGFELR